MYEGAGEGVGVGVGEGAGEDVVGVGVGVGEGAGLEVDETLVGSVGLLVILLVVFARLSSLVS